MVCAFGEKMKSDETCKNNTHFWNLYKKNDFGAGLWRQKSTRNRPEIAQKFASVHRDFPVQDGHRALQMYDSLYAEMMLFKLLKNDFYDLGVFRRH